MAMQIESIKCTYLQVPYRQEGRISLRTALSLPGFLFYAYFWSIPESRQGLFPTARVNVQNSSNFTGSVLLPDNT